MPGQLEKPRRGVFLFRPLEIARLVLQNPRCYRHQETAYNAAINDLAIFERGRCHASSSSIMLDTTSGTWKWSNAHTSQNGKRYDASPRIVHSPS